jgi:hypothetical protein
MNYAFQLGGIPQVGGGSYFGFSNATLPTLNELSLNEAVGLNSAAAAPFRTQYYCPNFAYVTTPGTSNGPIDWNCNGVASGAVAVNVNGDGSFGNLEGFDNWGNIVYGGGAVGGAGGRSSQTVLDELTLEEAHAHDLIG